MTGDIREDGALVDVEREPKITTRERLPNRRRVENVRLRAGAGEHEIAYTASLGFYADGRLGEIFISSGKTGSDLLAAAYETSIAASFALQFGCSVEEMASAMPRRADGSPEGPLGTLLDMLGQQRKTPEA